MVDKANEESAPSRYGVTRMRGKRVLHKYAGPRGDATMCGRVAGWSIDVMDIKHDDDECATCFPD